MHFFVEMTHFISFPLLVQMWVHNNSLSKPLNTYYKEIRNNVISIRGITNKY